MRWRSISAAGSPGGWGGPRAVAPRLAPLAPGCQAGGKGVRTGMNPSDKAGQQYGPPPRRGIGLFIMKGLFDVLQSKTKIFRLPRSKISCALLLGERSPLWVNLRRRNRLRYRPGREEKGGKAPRHAGGAGRGERGSTEPPTTPRLQADAHPSPKSAAAASGEGEWPPGAVSAPSIRPGSQRSLGSRSSCNIASRPGASPRPCSGSEQGVPTAASPGVASFSPELPSGWERRRDPEALPGSPDP